MIPGGPEETLARDADVGPGPAIIILVQVDRDDVSILRAASTRRLPWPDEHLLPGADPGTARGAAQAGRVFVVAFLDGAGNVLAATESPADPVTFMDRPDGQRAGVLRGGPLRPSRDRRLLHAAVPDGSAYLLFFRKEVEQVARGGQVASPPTGVALYSLIPSPTGRPFPASAPSGLYAAMQLPSPLPDPRPFPRDRPFTPPPMGPQPGAAEVATRARRPGPDNYIDGIDTLKPCSGGSGRCFNIVIMGDGFADTELCMFTRRAEEITRRLMRIPPFDSADVQAALAVHMIRVVSHHSGIDNCPYPGVRKDTYFDLEGNWEDVGYAGFFGTPHEETIYDVGSLIAPPEEVGLYVILANTALPGGRGDAGTRFAYVSIESDDQTLADVVAHEGAHALAGLTDEYIGCDPDQPQQTYPNLTTEEHVRNDDVWWKRLATREELKRGRFRAIHRLGDKLHACTREPILRRRYQEMLGLFWGCSYIDQGPPPPDGCDPLADPRGARYYRPMARCKMRKLEWAFCTVCRAQIRQAILRRTTGP